MKLYLRCYNKMKPVLRFLNFERLNCEILRTLYDVAVTNDDRII